MTLYINTKKALQKSMKQNNVNWQYLHRINSNSRINSERQIIKIQEDSLTELHNQQPSKIDCNQEFVGTNNIDRANYILTNTIGSHQLSTLDRFKDFQCSIEHHRTTNLHLVRLSWSTAFELIQHPSLDNYIIYIVRAGFLHQQIDRQQQLMATGKTATILNCSQTLLTTTSEEGEALIIILDRHSIDRVVEKLLHRSIKQAILFPSTIDLNSELGLHLQKFAQFLWDNATAAQVNSTSLVLQELEAAFFASVIKGFPHNYSEEIVYRTDGALSYYVHKAKAFIESHLENDLALSDIAAAVGVSSRVLQKAFSQHCDYSPMRFVTQSRLYRIRAELEGSTPDTKIVEVMMRYGITQGGKFAKEYQQLFGEKPSDTLKRSHQTKDSNFSLWEDLDDSKSDRIVGGVVRIFHRWIEV